MDTLTRRRRRWNGRKRPHDRQPAVQPVERARAPHGVKQGRKAGPFDDPARVTELEILLGCYGIGIELRRAHDD